MIQGEVSGESPLGPKGLKSLLLAFDTSVSSPTTTLESLRP